LRGGLVEEVWEGMKVGPRWSEGEVESWFGRKEQVEVWERVEEGLKRDVRLAHKRFQPGVMEGERR